MEECKTMEKHEEIVQRAQKTMPTEEEFERMSLAFKALSEPCRLRILFALRHGELCVMHVVEAAGGQQSAVSHQLRLLKANGIVKARREGRNVLYSLADEHVTAVIELTCAHLKCSF